MSIRFKEHHFIDRQIGDLAIRRDLAGVGQDIGLFYVVIVVLYEGIQRAVDGVVLAGFDLDGSRSLRADTTGPATFSSDSWTPMSGSSRQISRKASFPNSERE